MHPLGAKRTQIILIVGNGLINNACNTHMKEECDVIQYSIIYGISNPSFLLSGNCKQTRRSNSEIASEDSSIPDAEIVHS